jgi:hypothetical protein
MLTFVIHIIIILIYSKKGELDLFSLLETDKGS